MKPAAATRGPALLVRVVAALLASTIGCAAAAADALVVYPSYSAGGVATVEGRLIEARTGLPADVSDARWRNLVRNMRLLRNDERANRPVSVTLADEQGVATTDAEGYFRIDLPHAGRRPAGWHRLLARSGPTTATGELLSIAKVNRRGLISDLDDTILVTEVNDRSRMLKNTFLRNPAQRQAVAGMAALYAGTLAVNADPAASPLFYLSASPRQLHGAISAFLERNRFPPGVLMTRKITDDKTGDPWLDTMRYKIGRIEDILARVADVRFVLVGDDGEHDPEVYDWIRRHHPDRIEAIWIRQVNPDPKRPRLPAQRDLAEVLRETALGQGLPPVR